MFEVLGARIAGSAAEGKVVVACWLCAGCELCSYVDHFRLHARCGRNVAVVNVLDRLQCCQHRRVEFSKVVSVVLGGAVWWSVTEDVARDRLALLVDSEVALRFCSLTTTSSSP